MPTATGHTKAIRAKKVTGTDVKGHDGEKLGKVEDIVIDKESGQVMFAVVGFGAVLGMGEKFHPIPWAALDYNDDADAYVVNFTKDQLKAAPCDSIEELTKNDGLAFRDRSFDHYDTPRYWS